MPRYNWDEIQAFYNQGHTARECRERFGFTSSAWTDAAKRGAMKRQPRRRFPVQIYLLLKSSTRWNVRERLFAEGLLQNKCYECGISQWFGERLPLHLDHINGINNDHRLENLRMLCPNCHSQTLTFGGRNVRRKIKDALEAKI